MVERIDSKPRDLGGFMVGRVLPDVERRAIGPFVFLDHIGPTEITKGLPRSADVRPHPHIGLSTLTYLFEGEITHRDSLGFEQTINPGEVNWMTAGRGITHSERFERLRAHGGKIHGVQVWVALPNEAEECEPVFQHVARDALPSWSARGLLGRLIAGTAHGLTSPVTTYSPLFYAHVELETGAELELPEDFTERAAYLANGRVQTPSGECSSGQLLVFQQGEHPQMRATAPSTLIVLGGESVGPRHLFWNFVSSRTERIERAKQAWKGRRMPPPVNDTEEFTPLPEDSSAPR